MLSLHQTHIGPPWFARPLRNQLEFSDESAASTTSTEEQISFYNSYRSKKVSEKRPRSAQQICGDFLDLPAGKARNLSIFSP